MTKTDEQAMAAAATRELRRPVGLYGPAGEHPLQGLSFCRVAEELKGGVPPGTGRFPGRRFILRHEPTTGLMPHLERVGYPPAGRRASWPTWYQSRLARLSTSGACSGSNCSTVSTGTPADAVVVNAQIGPPPRSRRRGREGPASAGPSSLSTSSGTVSSLGMGAIRSCWLASSSPSTARPHQVVAAAVAQLRRSVSTVPRMAVAMRS